MLATEMQRTKRKHHTQRRLTEPSPKMVDMPGMETSAMGFVRLCCDSVPFAELAFRRWKMSFNSGRSHNRSVAPLASPAAGEISVRTTSPLLPSRWFIVPSIQWPAESAPEFPHYGVAGPTVIDWNREELTSSRATGRGWRAWSGSTVAATFSRFILPLGSSFRPDGRRTVEPGTRRHQLSC